MESLKARLFAERSGGYAADQMSENIALLSVRGIRYKTAGATGESYNFGKIDNDWKVLTALVHDPDVMLRTD
jgi:hypothetical protein